MTTIPTGEPNQWPRGSKYSSGTWSGYRNVYTQTYGKLWQCPVSSSFPISLSKRYITDKVASDFWGKKESLEAKGLAFLKDKSSQSSQVIPNGVTRANCLGYEGHTMILHAKKVIYHFFCVEWSVKATRMRLVPYTCVYDKHAHAKQFEGCAGGWGAGLGCGSMMPIYLSDIS